MVMQKIYNHFVAQYNDQQRKVFDKMSKFVTTWVGGLIRFFLMYWFMMYIYGKTNFPTVLIILMLAIFNLQLVSIKIREYENNARFNQNRKN